MARKVTRLQSVRRARAQRERPDWVPSAEIAQREVRRMRKARYRRHRQNVAFVIAVLSFALGYLTFSLWLLEKERIPEKPMPSGSPPDKK